MGGLAKVPAGDPPAPYHSAKACWEPPHGRIRPLNSKPLLCSQRFQVLGCHVFTCSCASEAAVAVAVTCARGLCSLVLWWGIALAWARGAVQCFCIAGEQNYLPHELLEALFKNTSMVSVKQLSTEGLKTYTENEEDEVKGWLEDFEDLDNVPDDVFSEVCSSPAVSLFQGRPPTCMCMTGYEPPPQDSGGGA